MKGLWQDNDDGNEENTKPPTTTRFRLAPITGRKVEENEEDYDGEAY